MNIRHRFLAGVHVSRDPEGIEGNVQIALGTIRKKKYERVANRRNTEEQDQRDQEQQEGQQEEQQEEQQEAILQTSLQATSEAS